MSDGRSVIKRVTILRDESRSYLKHTLKVFNVNREVGLCHRRSIGWCRKADGSFRCVHRYRGVGVRRGTGVPLQSSGRSRGSAGLMASFARPKRWSSQA